jgi:hypothetical protein
MPLGFIDPSGEIAREEEVKRAELLGGLTGWIRFEPSRLRLAERVSPKVLEALGKGETVTFGVANGSRPPVYPRVAAGDTLGYTGVFGSLEPEHASEERRPQLHWEIFAESNLLSAHVAERFAFAVEDADQDYNLDTSALLRLMRAALNSREPGLGDRVFADEELSADEVKAFYNAQDKAVQALRRCAARFVCEWGINLPSAVPNLHAVRRIRDPRHREQLIGAVANRVREQLWWQDAVRAGAPLPSTQIWHFHPLGFVELFSEAELAREAAGPGAGAAESPGLTEIPFDIGEESEVDHFPDRDEGTPPEG